MSCKERIQIEEFVKGKLTPQQMLEVDSHIRECADCKKLAASLSARVDLASALTGASDCPEYEELSAYIDESLDAARAAAVRNHANLCEFCSKDLDKMREMRSHSSLRDKVTVVPGASRAQRRSVWVYWKHALAVTSAAGLVAAAMIFGNFGSQPATGPQRTALNPPERHVNVVAPPAQPKVVTDPARVAVAKPQLPKPEPVKVAADDPKPAPIVTPPVLRDGKYSVVRKGSGLSLAKGDGSSVNSKLDSRIAARIDEKLRTGRIRLPEPVKMAMATFTMRANDDDYQPQPAAPKPTGPIDRIVMSAYPTFKWSAVDLADAYRVRVYDEAGNMVAEQITTSTALKLSSPLTRGKAYHWRVAVRFGEADSWIRSGNCAFYVLSTQDYDAINDVRAKLHGSHLALGAAYESAGLYEEAAGEYRLLLQQNPKSKLAKDLLQGVTQR